MFSAGLVIQFDKTVFSIIEAILEDELWVLVKGDSFEPISVLFTSPEE